MERSSVASGSSRSAIAVLAGLSAVVGGAAFWWWREQAPLARRYRRAKERGSSEDGSRDRGPNPESEPGTDPV